MATMSLKEAADTLKVHPRTMEELIRNGSIPAGKVGRAYVLMKQDVLAYAQNIILKQTADRLLKQAPTKAAPKGRTRVGSRTSSASAGSCVP